MLPFIIVKTRRRTATASRRLLPSRLSLLVLEFHQICVVEWIALDALADFTANREFHPALKTSCYFIVNPIVLLLLFVVNHLGVIFVALKCRLRHETSALPAAQNQPASIGLHCEIPSVGGLPPEKLFFPSRVRCVSAWITSPLRYVRLARQ